MMKKLAGTKGICEFVQDHVLTAVEAVWTGRDDKDKIIDGICHALTYKWLVDAFTELKRDGQTTLDNVMDNDKVRPPHFNPNKTDDVYLYKQIASNYVTYDDSFDELNATYNDLQTAFKSLTPSPPEEMLRNAFIAYMIADKTVIKTHPQRHASIASGGLERIIMNNADNAFFVGLHFDVEIDGEEEHIGHSVGFLNAGSVVYFFDPNFGLYKIGDDINSIADCIALLYKDLVKEYTENNTPVEDTSYVMFY